MDYSEAGRSLHPDYMTTQNPPSRAPVQARKSRAGRVGPSGKHPLHGLPSGAGSGGRGQHRLLVLVSRPDPASTSSASSGNGCPPGLLLPFEPAFSAEVRWRLLRGLQHPFHLRWRLVGVDVRRESFREAPPTSAATQGQDDPTEAGFGQTYRHMLLCLKVAEGPGAGRWPARGRSKEADSRHQGRHEAGGPGFNKSRC